MLSAVDAVSPFAYEAYYILRNDPAFSNFEIPYVLFSWEASGKRVIIHPLSISKSSQFPGSSCNRYHQKHQKLDKDEWFNTEKEFAGLEYPIFPVAEKMPDELSSPGLDKYVCSMCGYSSQTGNRGTEELGFVSR